MFKNVEVVTNDFTNGWVGVTDGIEDTLGRDTILWVDFEGYDLSPLPFKVNQVKFI